MRSGDQLQAEGLAGSGVADGFAAGHERDDAVSVLGLPKRILECFSILQAIDIYMIRLSFGGSDQRVTVAIRARGPRIIAEERAEMQEAMLDLQREVRGIYRGRC